MGALLCAVTSMRVADSSTAAVRKLVTNPASMPPAINGPVRIVAGRADTYCPAEALAGLAGSWPAATITVIDGADHFFFGGLQALDAALADWAARLST